MVLSFIVAVAGPILGVLVVPNPPTIASAYSVILAAMAIAFLAWQAPAIAAGMISGGPSRRPTGSWGCPVPETQCNIRR